VYVNLTTVATGEQPIENAAIVAEEMLGWLRGVEGFQGLLMLSREGTTLGLTFWESRELAERNRPLRMQFLERVTSVADVEIRKLEAFDVVFAELAFALRDGDE
jgi:hypothetical protein